MLQRIRQFTLLTVFMLYIEFYTASGTAAWTTRPRYAGSYSRMQGAGVAATTTCPIAYSEPTAVPLLLGGVEEGCVAGCQPRNGSVWNKACKWDPANPPWGLCQPQQQPQLLAYMKDQVQQGVADASILDLHPCQLYDLLASGGRTLWLIGDSHIKQIYAAMRCFMTDFWSHAQGECAASSVDDLQDQLTGVTGAGHNYNTPPRCLNLIGGSGARICLVHSPKGDMFFAPNNPMGIGTLELLARSFVAPQDIMYISVGRWHANNCQGVNSNWGSILTNIGRFAQGNALTLPNIFFSPSPFDHIQCAPNKAPLMPPTSSCVPYTQGGYSMEVWQALVQQAQHTLLETYGVPIVDTYKWTVPLHFAHIPLPSGGWDCLHYCRPGLPEIEIWHMWNAIKSRGLWAGTPNQHRNNMQAAGGGECKPVAGRFSGAERPPMPLDRDDLGQLLPAEPADV